MSDEQETRMSNNNNNYHGTCVVCYKKVEIYSIGMCEHPVCYECSTRMRVLCRQNECPICRQDLPKVVFTKEIQPFRHIKKGNLLDTRYNVFFDSLDIQEKFTQLLAHVCPLCKNKQIFGVFTGLKDHMRRKHELNYCDLCVENLKIFSYERRCYTRPDLALHRRKGDVDDKSHKGHPLCEFCDCRYMDNDELFRHLRRDHLFCHFCDADGLHHYYSSYDDLRDHFCQDHYLCDEGSCAEEKFTSVFRSEIDLKAHKSTVHGKFMGKAAAKQARTLELEFTLAPRGDSRNGRRGQSGGPLGPSNSRNSRDHYQDSRDFSDGESAFFIEPELPSMKQPDVQSTQEFPSLRNASTPMVFGHTNSKGRGNLTIRGSFKPPKLSMTNENFPALRSDLATPGVTNTVNLSVYSTNKASSSGTQNSPSSSSNVSIQVKHKTNSSGSITTRVVRPNIKPAAQLPKKTDFPALGGGSRSSVSSASSSNTAQWTKVTCDKPIVTPKTKKVAPAHRLDTPSSPVSFTEAFPSLLKATKTKKQSTISVTRNNTYSSTWKQGTTENSSDQNSTNDTANTPSKNKKNKKVKVVSSNSSNSNSSGNESGTFLKVQNNDQASSQAYGSSDSNKVVITDKKKKKSHADLAKKENEKSKKDKKENQNKSSNQIISEVEKNDNSSGSRKRSELKIDKLSNTNNNVKKTEDVAASGKIIGASITAHPPPGFGTATPPPPGFTVKLNSIASSNGLTFTNSSGESYSIVPNDRIESSFIYSPPPNFQERNKNLVKKISEVLELSEAIEEFRYLSGLFRQELCTADDYYKRCRTEMGLSAFATIFPEMLVLLPDIAKQRQLFDLHEKEVGNSVKGLELCPTCGQVCKSGNDIKLHLSSHVLENNFPALGEATTIQSSSNWPRKST